MKLLDSRLLRWLLDSDYWDELLDSDYWDKLLDSEYWDELWFRLLKYELLDIQIIEDELLD